MASTTPETHTYALTSHDTALALVPPKHLWPRLDRLRALYDKAYPAWPPHVNLIYPFVRPEALDAAVAQISSALSDSNSDEEGDGLKVGLDRVGVFETRKGNTIHLTEGDEGREQKVKELRRGVIKALGAVEGGKGFKMHLTMAQSEDVEGAPHKFLVEKVGFVPRVEWAVGELCVLVRERVENAGIKASRMRLWGTIGLDGRVERVDRMVPFYEEGGVLKAVDEVDEVEEEEEVVEEVAEKDQLHTGLPYYFDDEMDRWVPFRSSTLDTEDEPRETLTVASYNVLAEFLWPASDARYPLLIKNMLAENATADVLVLQEVTDGFLSYLLGDEHIRDTYPFCSHGPPHQDDIEPLPSYLNIVVLSKLAFDWEYVSFHRKHKGAVVARFKDIGRFDNDKLLPVVLATVHLSHGLTDGAVAAKKTDIKRILGYLSETYPGHPWILAGDFNVRTSSASIDAALKKKAISDLTASHLANLDNLFAKAGLDDAWRTSLAEDGDTDDDDSRVVEGEQGATWDPNTNGLAAAMAISGNNTWPQRYDRILARGEGLLKISKFNMFGFLTEAGDTPESDKTFASDHWGIRCTMDVGEFGETVEGPSEEISNLVVPVHLEKASEHLAQAGSVKESLTELGVIPGEEETATRKVAFNLLKSILLDTPDDTAASTRSQPAVVVVPVGSYALDIWTSSSDIDVLCIGPFSTRTFFALASQRLRKAAAQGIRILRRVRANTGTMLELEVHGIKMDLQYCPATNVAERWPDVLRTPASDPVWSLSAQTLSKLKAIRDIDYLRRSVPDLAVFRLAHRFIKTWAKSRGIYSARFGFLSGIQISLLLARVCKLLARESGNPSVEDLLTTFFTHYASFDWSTKIAFDPLFHRNRLPYTRTSREPLSILGYYPPTLNTALVASIPSTRTLALEFRRARDALTSVSSWTEFLSSPTATTDFLTSHKSYIKLDVSYWGLSQTKGAQFLGWLESRCVMLLVDLHRRAPGLHARMWPGRFVEQADTQSQPHEEGEGADGNNERDYRGCYLIGLDKADASMSKDEVKLALGALQTVLGGFESRMRGDERYFDVNSSWLSAAVVSKAELGDLDVDAREWGEYTPGEEEEDDEDEEEEEVESESDDLKRDSEYETRSGKKNKKGKGAAAKQQTTAVDLRADKTKGLRTAADVMNRLRWDPQLDSSDYVVGYEDRFTGTQEKELEAWKSEQTDEEFIPQHRILYFRRRSDGRKVWDRRTKFDELFGNVLPSVSG